MCSVLFFDSLDFKVYQTKVEGSQVVIKDTYLANEYWFNDAFKVAKIRLPGWDTNIPTKRYHKIENSSIAYCQACITIYGSDPFHWMR